MSGRHRNERYFELRAPTLDRSEASQGSPVLYGSDRCAEVTGVSRSIGEARGIDLPNGTPQRPYWEFDDQLVVRRNRAA